MAQLKCIECGQVFDKNLDACPNCGCPASECEAVVEKISATTNASSQTNPQKPYIFEVDWGQKIYECCVIYWHIFQHFKCKGRASRIEYWSYFIISTLVEHITACAFALFVALFIVGTNIGFEQCYSLVFMLLYIIHTFPYIGVLIRRLHDINRSGWWWLVPIAPVLMCFKKSDEGANKYGLPSDVKLQ